MKTPFFIAPGLAVCLLLTSCVTDSVNPLSSPETARADPQLVGDWHGGGAEPSTFRFTITKAPWMHVEIIPDRPDDKTKPGEMPEAYDFFPTIIGKNTFLNVVMVGKDDKGNPAGSYVFLRYKFRGDRVLQMWMMSQEATAAAIRSGKLKGLVRKNGFTLGQPSRPDVDVTLQDSSANLVAFIQSANLKEIFNGKMNAFSRVKGTGNRAND